MMKTYLNAANIRAIEAIYVSAMLEELQLFSVMDRLVALFQSGVLPIQSYSSGEKLYKYWKHSPQRLSMNDRKSLYSRSLGIGGGDGPGTNRGFADLWLRFISSVLSAGDPNPHAD